MSTYFDSKGNLRPFPWIKADELGAAREHLHFVPTGRPGISRQFRNRPANRETEMFFSVEMLDGTRSSGWLTRNETTKRFTDYLIQDRAYNQHIKFIEWGEPHSLINCVVCDGIYISEAHFFMAKDEFAKFMERIEPAVEMPPKNRR